MDAQFSGNNCFDLRLLDLLAKGLVRAVCGEMPVALLVSFGLFLEPAVSHNLFKVCTAVDLNAWSLVSMASACLT